MTELAQQLIEREKQARTGSLDLGRCGLHELPDLSRLHWLHTLNLVDDWWDWEQRDRIYSQNKGGSNRLKTPPSHFFPIGLSKLVLAGGSGAKLSIDQRETNESLERIEQGVRSTEQMSTIIQSNQHVHSTYLNSLLHYAQKHAADLQATFSKVDALSPADQPDLDRISDLLDERFGALLDKLPSSHEIVQKWKEANAKEPLAVDARLKLKLKLPFLFGELEKEFAWDSKAAFLALRSELTAFAKGEKTLRELFVED